MEWPKVLTTPIYGSGLGAAAIKAAGKSFVCRYLSPQPNSKNITKAEFDNLRKAGLAVALVWEIGANRMLAGQRRGRGRRPGGRPAGQGAWRGGHPHLLRLRL